MKNTDIQRHVLNERYKYWISVFHIIEDVKW